MSERRVMFLRKSLIGSCALVALVLLASFYSIVNGAVDRATRERTASSDAIGAAAAIVAPSRSARAGSLLARAGN